ncbi:MAG: TRAP transporter small permease [Anaeromyxobacteraceae bacterium]
MIERLRRGLERVLEGIAILLLTALAVVVLVGIAARTVHRPFVWYDEVASITLAWLSYYGAALGALKRAHIGMPEIVRLLPAGARRWALVASETVVFGFFALLAWVGWRLFLVAEGDRLVSLPWMPLQVAQSIIPVGAVLFLVAEALSLPRAWRATAAPHGPGPAPSAPEAAAHLPPSSSTE